jgi:hypothetical protein
MASIDLQVALKEGSVIVTKFPRNIREFGLSADEVDRYIELLRIAQMAARTAK